MLRLGTTGLLSWLLVLLLAIVAREACCEVDEEKWFSEVPCKLIFGVVPPLVHDGVTIHKSEDEERKEGKKGKENDAETETTSMDAGRKINYEIGVFAPEDYPFNTVLEVQPSALFSSFAASKSILNNYVHGFNRTHTVVFFGSSSLYNHGEKNIVENFIWGNDTRKFGVQDVTLKTLKPVKKGEEMFAFYNAIDMERTKGGKSKPVIMSWFGQRDLSVTNTSDTAIYPGKLTSSSLLLDGCADNQHVEVSETGVSVKLAVKAGDVIETNRILFLFTEIAEFEPSKELFWKLSSARKGLFLGVTLSFARFTTDENLVNVKVDWWEDQVFYEQDMGLISVTATKDLQPGEHLYIKSQSNSARIFPEDFAAKYNVQRTFLIWLQEQYEETSLVAKIYAGIMIAFASMFLFV